MSFLEQNPDLYFNVFFSDRRNRSYKIYHISICNTSNGYQNGFYKQKVLPKIVLGYSCVYS